MGQHGALWELKQEYDKIRFKLEMAKYDNIMEANLPSDYRKWSKIGQWSCQCMTFITTRNVFVWERQFDGVYILELNNYFKLILSLSSHLHNFIFIWLSILKPALIGTIWYWIKWVRVFISLCGSVYIYLLNIFIFST